MDAIDGSVPSIETARIGHDDGSVDEAGYDASSTSPATAAGALPFVCLDERLADAALREGMDVVAGP